MAFYSKLGAFNVKSFLSATVRGISSEAAGKKTGVVLGVYEKEGGVILSSAAEKVQSQSSGNLEKLLTCAGPSLKKGKTRVFYGLVEEHTAVAVVGLGKQNLAFNELEEIDERKDAIRVAAAAGCAALRAVDINKIWIEDFGNAQLAAEGAELGTWINQDLRAEAKRKPEVEIHALSLEGECGAAWERGLVTAQAQNLARKLMDTPSNLMTPTIFGECALEALCQFGVEVKLHDKSWAEEQGMGAFLGVSQGSTQPPVFIEAVYNNGPTNQKPIVLVGKGVTFDSGGISIKPSAGMEEMRGDMGGAACVIGTLQAVARLKLPVNVTALIPLCENMPSGSAVKPGDVVRAKNGKTIRVDNTDAEGRLILADALSYAATLNPRFTLDMATLTGAMRIALGGAATGVFTNSTCLYEVLKCSGIETGDRVWRMPLWQHYTKQVTEAPNADVVNVGGGKGGGACTAAAFLKEFAPPGDWLHLDIAGVMSDGESIPYLGKGMTGRPTRTIIEFILRHSGQ